MLPGAGREEKRLAEVARMDSDTIGDLRRTRVPVLGAASITGNISGTGSQLVSLKRVHVKSSIPGKGGMKH